MKETIDFSPSELIFLLTFQLISRLRTQQTSLMASWLISRQIYLSTSGLISRMMNSLMGFSNNFSTDFSTGFSTAFSTVLDWVVGWLPLVLSINFLIDFSTDFSADLFGTSLLSWYSFCFKTIDKKSEAFMGVFGCRDWAKLAKGILIVSCPLESSSLWARIWGEKFFCSLRKNLRLDLNEYYSMFWGKVSLLHDQLQGKKVTGDVNARKLF